MAPPAFAAQRLAQEELQAGKLKPPPFNSPQAAAEEVKRTDFAGMSSKDCAKKVILEATKEAAVQSAMAMHEGDTKAVALTVAEALQEVFAKEFLTDTVKTFNASTNPTPSSTSDFNNKFVTQAVLDSLSLEDRKKTTLGQGR